MVSLTDYTLTDVRGEVELADGLDLEFSCNPKEKGQFRVVIDAPFDPQK